MPQELFDSLKADPLYDGQLVATAVEPPRAARYAAPARPLPPALAEALARRGYPRLYEHQARTLDLARAGAHVTLVTPTASGKTLACLLPVLEGLLADPQAKALFLYPIKALAQDQCGILNQWLGAVEGCKGQRADIYDGDTTPYRRTKIKKEPPALLLSNPDMLHLGLLPYHSGWGGWLRQLKVVVVDEAHSYRGVFGAHVAMVLRRLRRLARFYGGNPQFILLSATMAEPGGFAASLLGEETQVVEASGAPQGERHIGLWNPLASPYREASTLFGQLLQSGRKSIAFTKARKITELMTLWTQQDRPALRDKIAGYRAGYLPEQRRAIEQQLFSGALDGVITTSALELGIDVGGLDACLLVGFPGTMISARQRMGRVGRGGQASVVLMVGLNDALDQYFMRHPEAFFGRPTERARVPVDNPVILANHLACAAAELPLEPEDARWFGPAFEALAEAQWRSGRLRKGAEGKYHAVSGRPTKDVNLRSCGESFLIQASSGKGKDPSASFNIGTLEVPRVYRDGHPGAIYLHQGAQWQVLKLDLEAKRVLVKEVEVEHYTEPRGEDHIEIVQVEKCRDLGGLRWCWGQVRAREQVTGYVTKHVSSQKVLSEHALEMPLHEYETKAAWWELPAAWRKEFAELGLDFAGSIHALEHAQIALLPVFALCDRWDLGGVSYWSQPQLDVPAIFIYDGHAGGAALAEQGWDIVGPWLDAVEELLRDCPCEDGCPACIQSPKCGNGNKPLDKGGAKELVRRLKARLSGPATVTIEPEKAFAAQTANPPATPPHPALERHPPLKGRDEVGASVKAEDTKMPDDIVVFDLETQFLADEVGGWDNTAAMKVSVAVLWSVKDQAFRQYTEGQVPALIARLKQADLVVGFNHVKFDYGVLAGYPGGEGLVGQTRNLDLLLEVTKTLGRRLKLDSLAQATLKASKSADGLQAVAWWREGRLAELLAYCQQDVAVTRDLWEFGKKYGYLLYEDKQGLMRLPASW
jgi:DEAD/DEAH box helicase domain-containing protein